MSETPEFEKEFHKESKSNLLENFDACLDAVMQIETIMAGQSSDKDKQIIREQMSAALSLLVERRQITSSQDLVKFEQRVITGFQGLGGFNRYILRGDGSIGLLQSHSTTPCLNKAKELGIETPEYGF